MGRLARRAPRVGLIRLLNPGALLVGALTALGGGVLVTLPLLATGVVDTDTIGGQTILIATGFGAQFGAGWIAARVAGTAEGVHGGLAALLLHTVVAVIALAAGEEPSFFTLATGAFVALVLGTAAGILAQARRT